MTIEVHRSSHPKLLIGALGDVLAQIPSDPFVSEMIAVPSRGIERWIAQELAERFGVAANIEFPTVRRLLEDVIAAADGRDRTGDPWSSLNLRWRVARAIDACSGEPSMAIVDRFLASGQSADRWMEAAVRIAGLFQRYEADRPEMLCSWAAGEDSASDGSPLDDALCWQPRMWRSVRETTGVPSPAERLPEVAERIATGSVDLDLPDRIFVYGMTRISRGHLATLQALGATRSLHLFVLHPSPAAISRVSGDDPDTLPQRISPGMSDHHPLVASWGRDALELHSLLRYRGLGTTSEHESDDRPVSALQRLQEGIREDAMPEPSTISDDDHSLQIHSCHGPTRQVEVLRDALLHAMTTDPTIQPRDIVVMCPDVETYAPLVEAVFSPSVDTAESLPELRVRVADRSPRALNPLLVVLNALVDLARSRIGGEEVLDLAALDPVRRALDIGDAELSEMSELVADANIRWGLDAQHREAGWGLPPLDDQTWQFGLDRLLSGIFVPDTRTDLVGGALPVPGIEGSALGGLGCLAEIEARVEVIERGLVEPRSAADWRTDLLSAVETIAAVDWGDEWQWGHLSRSLDEALSSDDDTPVTFGEVVTVLGQLGSGRASRSNHRTGQLTVCTLVPMRSVPHRVVALLGMDDEVFPRSPGRDGDDLLRVHALAGDRDRNAEDRQLLLDAVMAAQDHLIVTYSGHDERTNAERPPAVPIAELLDVIDRTFVADDGHPRRRVIRQHPLQSFDPRNFGSVDPESWGFDELALAGAEAVSGGMERVDPPFLETPLVWEWDETLALGELAAFVEAPVRSFVIRQLGFSLREIDPRGEDLIPIDLDSLEQWAVGDRLLRGRLAGDEQEIQHRAERRRGSLPPGELADQDLEVIEGRVSSLYATAETAEIAGEGATVPVDVTAPNGVRLIGDVGGLHGTRLGVVQYSLLKRKHRLSTFVRVAALTLQDPSVRWDAVAVGRGPRDEVACVRIGPLGADEESRRVAAEQAIGMLVDLYGRGMAEPLPIYTETTGAFALGGDKGWKKARPEWVTGWSFPKEDQDPYHRYVLGGVMPFEGMWSERPRRDEQGEGWPSARSRFEAYALRLWGPVVMEELK